MPNAAETTQGPFIAQANKTALYRDVLITLNTSGLPYLVGGAYAFNYYTGLNRRTEDFDLFVSRADYDNISNVLTSAGYHTELTYPHWLGKVFANGDVIDLIFSSGNAIADVDAEWFQHATPAKLFGIQTLLCPVEEMLWSKAFVMERERFDGSDVAHLLLARGRHLDWKRLLRRFEPHWRLLLSHLTLFGFIYPAHRDAVPAWVMDDLLNRLQDELAGPVPEDRTCAGTLLSREQYLNDVHQWGYQDARISPYGYMSAEDAARWTDAINNKDG